MLTITPHAVERYIERIAPGTSEATARARLEVHAASAARLRQKTPSGDHIYLAQGLCRLIVRKSDRGEQGGVVITVLPLEDGTQPDLSDTMQALSMSTAILATLDREQLLDVKAELAKQQKQNQRLRLRCKKQMLMWRRLENRGD